MTVQNALDNYIANANLKTVSDLIYLPGENRVFVVRKEGYRSLVLDVDSSSDIINILEKSPAIY